MTAALLLVQDPADVVGVLATAGEGAIDDSTPLIAGHLDYMRWRNMSSGTIEQRRLTLARLRRHGVEPASATSAQLLAFRDRLTREGKPLAPASQAAELSHLRAWYRWLSIEGHRADDPTVKVPRPRLPRALPHPMPEPDFARVVADAPERVRPWLLLAGFAGLRACEIAPLRAEDLWWSTAPPLIHIRRGKGGHEGLVPLAPEIAGELRALPRRGWLFPRRDGQLGHTPAHVVSQASNRYLHGNGVLYHSLHSLRHRFVTQVYRASGRDLRQTQELARHRSPVSTAIYAAVDPAEGAAIVAALPGLRHLRAVR